MRAPLHPLASEALPTPPIKQGIVGNRDSKYTFQPKSLLEGAMQKISQPGNNNFSGKYYLNAGASFV